MGISAAGGRRLELLDVLRFIAALMVVCFHWLFNGISNGKVEGMSHGPFAPVAIYGLFGVHLFFLISGYVISESAHGKTAGQFVVSRGVRLFPAYWTAMVLTTVVVNLWGTADLHVGMGQFLANIPMTPELFHRQPIDGVYWTLTLELSFYLLVFVVLILGFERFLDRVFPAWGILMLAVLLIAPQLSSAPFLGGYYALFATGAIMATIQRRGASVYTVVGLLASMGVSFQFVWQQIPEWNIGKEFQLSVPAVLILFACFHVAIALMWIPRVRALRIPLSRPVSDLTYPIYLLHAHIGYTVLDRLGTDANSWYLYPLMLAGLLASAWLLHWGVEVKPKQFWYRSFGYLRPPIDFIQSKLSRISAGRALAAPDLP